ncbi:hypothetical protein [Methylocystis bryophila]|uniref:hypothetical protein n=1 Tax=Methylocystis bryophila TaxID=655015 RepID=UPI001319FC8A|nr:hypothetical protein [Methylocystis bryophila]BDV40160.1 hypothetical protein DSM21852_34130 [Methylocystis bryophila]
MQFHPRVCPAPVKTFCVAILAALLASTPLRADEATWFFTPKEGNEPTKFGYTSGFSGESIFVFGRCESDGHGAKYVQMEISFKNAALAELVGSEAYPWVNFVTDGEAMKFAIEQLSLDEAGPSLWTSKVGNLSKDLFEELAITKKLSMQLLANDKVLDVYQAPSDRGRKEAMAQVLKECF